MSKTYEVRTLRETKCSSQVTIDREDVLKLLRRVIPKGATNIRIYVQVPGGADWSNMKLDIGEDADITVEWETQSRDVLEADFDKK